MSNKLNAEEILKAGGQLPAPIRREYRGEETEEINGFALRVLSVLVEVKGNDARRRVLDKARRMISTR